MIFEHFYCCFPIPPALPLLMVGKVTLKQAGDDAAEARDPLFQSRENGRTFLVHCVKEN